MKLIENKVWEYIQEPGVDGMYKAIRDNAMVCYQTDVEKQKLTPKEFVENVLLKNGHGRPLEFGTVYLMCNSKDENFEEYNEFWDVIILGNQYSNWESTYNADDTNTLYITTNLRVLAQGNYETDEEAYKNGYDKNYFHMLKYWCEPTEYHMKRRTFSMLMSRGCTDDSRTHVSLSSLCESTRFCNYSNDKFGNELTFIKPYWIKDEVVDYYIKSKEINNLNNCIFKYPINWGEEEFKQLDFLGYMETQELNYMLASKQGIQAQQLKRLFPLGCKAELRLCGYDDAWQNFFWRRCDSHADPECVIVANKIKELYNN